MKKERFTTSIKSGLLCLALIASAPIEAQIKGEAPKPITFPVQSFEVEGELPLSAVEVDAILSPHGGKDFDLDGLQSVAKELETAIRDLGFSFYRVVIPPQSLTDGRVTLKAVSFLVGEIGFQGNKHFSDENISKSLPGLEAGKSPNTEQLAQQLKVANRHPSKDTKLTFRQSKTEGFVDAMLNVQDVKPHLFSAIVSNTGSEDTGDWRITAAYQHANLFDRDHLLNLSYTTSPEQTQDVKQYGISYSAPLYDRKAWLSGYYVDSNVDSGVVNDVSVAGAGEMFGFHWLQYLPRIGLYEHWLDMGLDTRLFDNDIKIGTAEVDDIRSTPLSIQYQGEYAMPKTRLGFRIQYARNTGLGDKNSKEYYDSLNPRSLTSISGGVPNASHKWDALRFGAEIDHRIGDWGLRAVLDGQYSNEAMISGEQFGLGGSTSVRGYEERETSADSGVSVRSELHAPTWKDITFLGFLDYGYAHMHDPFLTEKSWHLASYGVGARATFMKQILVSVDVAHALKTPPEIFNPVTEAGDHFAHATLIWQY